MGFGHSGLGVQKLCVELASIIHANFHVAATIHPSRRTSSLYREFDEHYENQIRTKSIEVAVNLRNLFDRCSTLANPHPLAQASRGTSAIHFTTGSGPTTLRECANKVIHAAYFLFTFARYETVGDDGRTFTNEVQESKVELSGWHGKVQWRCTLDLLQFAEEAHLAALELSQIYEHPEVPSRDV